MLCKKEKGKTCVVLYSFFCYEYIGWWLSQLALCIMGGGNFNASLRSSRLCDEASSIERCMSLMYLLLMLQPFIYVYKRLVHTGFAPAESNRALAEVETASSQGTANYDYNTMDYAIFVYFTFLLNTSLTRYRTSYY
jgi:hypothetical protein